MEKLTPDVIRFNYYPGSSENDCERYEERIVGQKGVTEIIEHAAHGEGDKWYWDVHYPTSVERVFNPNMVCYTKTITS
jgi:hypothetical protein